jgi:hypothetical protein
MRFLGYTMGDDSTFAMGDDSAPMPPPSPELLEKMDEFIEAATKAGVLVATGTFGPVAEATKVVCTNGEFTVLDGPFTEAKELVGGWGLLEVRDKDEAIEWTKRVQAIVGYGETTLRQVY